VNEDFGSAYRWRAYIFLAALRVATYIHGASRETIIRPFTQLSFDDPQTWKRNHWLSDTPESE
jgi:hypothetical protein